MSNKVESLVIVIGLSITFLLLAIHFIRMARASKKESDKFKSPESISAIKQKMIDDNQNQESIKLSGSLESSRSIPSAIKETPKKKEKKKETQKPVYQDYLVEEDKELLRRVVKNEGDFVTSMLVAQATDSALLGTVVGGDPVGAIIGDMMNDTEETKRHDFDTISTDYSDSPSNDSSWDTTNSSSDWSSSDSSSDWSSSDSTSTSSDW
jgi:hypothetical protein